ncbi:DUF6660 family protein [Sphingobacterium mizutaii]|uniref:DUF6660 family protein n=1 Tax=Sphingobacterium mizutaii TaxID=1010 RepID=UPI00289CE8AD|nr:DUF6660 family protein [Sphingobacterium mizutaii]
MRFASVILMVYVMVLTFIPCSDRMTESHTHLHSGTEQSSHQEQHDCSKDSCTPFCTCSCCGISLTVANFHVFNLEKPIESYANIDLTEKEYPLVSNDQENIWQPPQV